MKKLVCVAVIAMTAVLSANAQFVKLGVKGGANFATLSGDDVEDTDMRTSFHVGGLVEFKLSDKFSFQPELLYSSQGAKEEFTEDGVTIETRLKTDYLNLPLMGKFYVAEGFSLQVGPQIGFLLSANAEVESGDLSIEDDVKDSFEEIDFGVNFGLGYQLPSGLFFDARYNLGLSNINGVENDDTNIKNSVIQVSLGFTF